MSKKNIDFKNASKIKIFAVASGGGHWMQLMRISHLLNQYDVHYLTTIDGLPQRSNLKSYDIIPEANRNSLLASIMCAGKILMAIIKIRPSVIITTGAAPGLIAIAFGRMFFAKTLWIDSIANGDQLSMSGEIAKKLSSVTLSQWESVAKKDAVSYWGRVL
jgi:hypothetical protein